MQNRRTVIGAVLALLGLPVAIATIEAVSFHVRSRTNGTIVSAGQQREYLLHVPRNYDRTRPVPLVISLHAAAMWAAAQKETSQWNTLAERQGFIVVYPSGTRDGGPRIWHVDRDPRLMKDVRFIADLIDTLQAAYNIDPSRIYANGLSNGGGMSFALSCTLSDRIAAVGMVAAAQTLPWSWCVDRRAVPMIAFHGTADPATPYTGGSSWALRGRFPNVPEWTAHWARRNRCAPEPVVSRVATDVIRRAYTKCADDADVVLYTVRGGGHTWPGGKTLPQWFVGRTSHSIDASGKMWAFFQEHPLRRAPIAAPQH